MHHENAFCTEYEKSKFLADRIALQAAAEGAPITLVYPGVMYGAGELTIGNFVSHLVREPSFLPPRTCQRPGCFILNLYLISNHT